MFAHFIFATSLTPCFSACVNQAWVVKGQSYLTLQRILLRAVDHRISYSTEGFWSVSNTKQFQWASWPFKAHEQHYSWDWIKGWNHPLPILIIICGWSEPVSDGKQWTRGDRCLFKVSSFIWSNGTPSLDYSIAQKKQEVQYLWNAGLYSKSGEDPSSQPLL